MQTPARLRNVGHPVHVTHTPAHRARMADGMDTNREKRLLSGLALILLTFHVKMLDNATKCQTRPQNSVGEPVKLRMKGA